MGLLQTAGIVSGFGQGLGKGLEQLQGGIIQYGLMQESQKFQELKLKEQMAHAEKLQGMQADVTVGEGEKTRASHSADIDTQTKAHSADAKSAQANAKDIADAANATHLATAKLQRQMQEKQFDKTFTTAKLSALKDTVRELGNEITRLSVVVANPLADKADPSYKSAVIQLESATKLHNLYAKQVGLEMNIDESSIDKSLNKPALPAFKMPPTSGSTRTPGVIQTPMPSATEQEMKRKSIQ